MGDGAFADGRLAAGLMFRVDPDDPTHGFVEPDAIMTVSDYQRALERTAAMWTIDED
jgi:hypothetical protein